MQAIDAAGNAGMTGDGPAGASVRDAELQIPSNAEQLMAMPALRGRPWTLVEVERLVEDRPGYTPRYELIDGKLLVTPAPKVQHQQLAGGLYRRLYPYARQHQIGEAVISPAAAELSPDSRVEPDVFVAKLAPGDRMLRAFPVRELVLAIELLSPSSARHDRGIKRRFYQASGVPEYWIVDGEARLVEVWLPSDERPAILTERIMWQPMSNVEPLIIELGDLWAEARLDLE